MKRLYEILIISIIFFIICFVYKGQQRTTLNGGKGWDGVNYYSITEQIQAGIHPVAGELPFIRRLGTAYLIAYYSKITGTNILDSALYINLAGVFITVILLLFWLKLFIEEFWIRGLLCFLFLMVWYVLLRYTFFNPIASDAWGAPWFLGGLLLLEGIRKSFSKKSYKACTGYLIAFSLVIAIGNWFRESNAILCLLPFFAVNPFQNYDAAWYRMKVSDGVHLMKQKWKSFFVRQSLLLFIPVIFILFSDALIYKTIEIRSPNDYSYLVTIVFWVYTKSLPEYLVAIFTAYGPLILLVPFFYRQYKFLFRERQELLVLLILSLLLGLAGGSDTERILFMSGFPVILMMIGISVRGIFNSGQRWWVYVLFVLQSVSFRFFWNLPDYSGVKLHTPFPFFGLIGSHFPYLSLYSRFGDYKVNSILLCEYMALFIATWYVLQNKIVINSKKDLRRHTQS